jgi:hypothetical protein
LPLYRDTPEEKVSDHPFQENYVQPATTYFRKDRHPHRV